ncbi:MAG: hypothetical protein JSU01_08595 [Bacteroidetes bacterium]|nr:hypothetical protein [Bacteroidota bacterium]
MNTIRQRLLTNWHFMRILRLVLSIWILVMAIPARDWAMGLIGVFFLYTALAGVGCCGPAGCYVPERGKDMKNNIKDTDYEEVK